MQIDNARLVLDKLNYRLRLLLTCRKLLCCAKPPLDSSSSTVVTMKVVLILIVLCTYIIRIHVYEKSFSITVNVTSFPGSSLNRFKAGNSAWEQPGCTITVFLVHSDACLQTEYSVATD